MKINFILPAPKGSGGINVIMKYAELFSRENKVTVYYPICPYYLKNDGIINKFIYCLTRTCINFFRYKKNKINDNLLVKPVFKIDNCFIKNADAIIATAWPTAYSVNKLNTNKGKKFYFIQDFEIWDNKEKGLESYLLPLEKIVISKWINIQLKENLDIGPFPIIYNGIDYEGQLKNNVNFNKKINFLMLNHKLEKKGVNNGIKVFEKVKKLYPKSSLRMFGLCSGENLPEYVEYIQNPQKEEIIKLYAETDIFIFPSIEEGWGLTPLEAMACGSVVVGTNTGFVLDLGINKKNMMISEINDVDAMVSNIKYLLNDYNKYFRIRQNGFELANSLKWKKSYKKFNKIISRSKYEK